MKIEREPDLRNKPTVRGSDELALYRLGEIFRCLFLVNGV